MSECRNLDRFLDRKMSEFEASRFLRHAQSCDSCTRQLRRWGCVQSVMTAEIATREEVAKPEKMARFNEKLALHQLEQNRRFELKKIVYFAAAAAIFVVLATSALVGFDTYIGTNRDTSIVVGVSQTLDRMVLDTNSTPSRLPTLERTPIEKTQSSRQRRLKSNKGITIGDHWVWVGPKGQAFTSDLENNQQVVTLTTGRLTVSVPPKKKGHQLSVVAGPFKIRVIGTIFEVNHLPGEKLEVLVAEGLVEVSGHVTPPVRVHAGQQLEIEKGEFVELKHCEEVDLSTLLTRVPQVDEDRPDNILIAEKTTQKAPPLPEDTVKEESSETVAAASNLVELRHLVLGRHYQEAEDRLIQHLAAHPQDFAAWSLLGDARRKMAKWEGAIDVYENIIASAPPSQSRRASYLAGILAQDHLGDHRRAERFFEGYLSNGNGKTVDGGGMVRLAKSKIALGKRAEARQLLSTVISETDDNTVRSSARELLGNLHNSVK